MLFVSEQGSVLRWLVRSKESHVTGRKSCLGSSLNSLRERSEPLDNALSGSSRHLAVGTGLPVRRDWPRKLTGLRSTLALKIFPREAGCCILA